MTIEPDLRKEFRDYLWKYFALHADQRLKTFNFFIVLVAAAAAGYMNLQAKDNPPIWSFTLPLSWSFASYVFWQLDVRTKQMIKIAEEGLKVLDLQSPIPSDAEFAVLRIFEFDEISRRANESSGTSIFLLPLSYSKCFNLVFLACGATGLIVAVLNAIQTWKGYW